MNAPSSVAIVGLGASHRDYISECGLTGSRWRVADEVWAINAMANIIDWDRAFAMDHPDLPLIKEYIEKNGLSSYEGYKKATKPIFCSDVHQDYPFEKYPLEEVVTKVGIPYMNNTVAYAIAYAIYLGVDEIKLYGIDFTYDDEERQHIYEKGRACVEFLIGIALSRGIKLGLAESTTLLDNAIAPEKRFYGYVDPVYLKLEVNPETGNQSYKRIEKPDDNERHEYI
jgi:hypothetical protein